MIDRRELLALAAASTAVQAGRAAGARRHAKVAKADGTRSAEVRALRTFAEKTHPRGREARDDHAWQARWARLERNASGLSDGSYFIGMRGALAWFEDGHSTVLPFEFLGKVPDVLAAGAFGARLPWKVRIFDDGAFVAAVDEQHRSILGAKVEQVGGLKTANLLKALSDGWAGNRAWAHNWAGLALASPAQLQGLGAIANPVMPVNVALAYPGRTVNLSISPQRAAFDQPVNIDRKKTEREGWAETLGRGNYVRPLQDRRALYLSIDGMDDVEGATFEQLTKDAFAAMDLPEVERLVVDLRRNGGGNNFLGEALRKRIERSRFNRPGALYILIGPATFSAAQNLANRLERETFALFVGGPTGLSPNHYGDAKIFTGPATGLTAMVSTLPWFDSYPQDRRPWIMPDLPVPATFDDWRNGRDPALELALTHHVDRPSDDLSRDRVFYYDRASQKADWKPFWA